MESIARSAPTMSRIPRNEREKPACARLIANGSGFYFLRAARRRRAGWEYNGRGRRFTSARKVRLFFFAVPAYGSVRENGAHRRERLRFFQWARAFGVMCPRIIALRASGRELRFTGIRFEYWVKDFVDLWKFIIRVLIELGKIYCIFSFLGMFAFIWSYHCGWHDKYETDGIFLI